MNGAANKTCVSDSPWTNRLVKLSAYWAMVKFPVEIWWAQDDIERGAIVFSTSLWIVVVVLVLRGSPAARGIFVFLSVLDVLAVAPALPVEFVTFRVGFYLSLVDSLIKGALAVIFVSRHMQVRQVQR
ncbi:hypothetical protein [Paraburkholderia sp. 22B1P]|uniref:hypothetical protein n=1 Tax=Paraburkholderia sp. 22B1P TaxID=3080498 RepID=UPI0030CCF658